MRALEMRDTKNRREAFPDEVKINKLAYKFLPCTVIF
jgi:hypothetical protein